MTRKFRSNQVRSIQSDTIAKFFSFSNTFCNRRKFPAIYLSISRFAHFVLDRRTRDGWNDWRGKNWKTVSSWHVNISDLCHSIQCCSWCADRRCFDWWLGRCIVLRNWRGHEIRSRRSRRSNDGRRSIIIALIFKRFAIVILDFKERCTYNSFIVNQTFSKAKMSN